jgi:hypothetical protein
VLRYVMLRLFVDALFCTIVHIVNGPLTKTALQQCRPLLHQLLPKLFNCQC